MPCYNCGSEFGIFKKEVGCELCGFAFCSKCCKKRPVSTGIESTDKRVVCNKCSNNLLSDKKTTVENSASAVPKKRMASLKKQAFSVDSGYQMPSLTSEWTNEKDKEIAERLQKFKRERTKDLALPSEMEIEERLAKLKGMDPTKYKAPPIMVYRPPDRLTSVEKASALLEQVREEVDLDSKLVRPEDEIAARLARLRDEKIEKEQKVEPNFPTSATCDAKIPKQPEEMDVDVSSTNLTFQQEYFASKNLATREIKELNTSKEFKDLMTNIRQEKDSDEDNERDEAEANEIIEKLLATNMDDDDMEELDSLPTPQDYEEKRVEKSSEEEFPWCIICTEDAKIRCFGCDNDIYCMRCFKECHDSLDIRDHKTCPYFPPKDSL